MSTYAAEWRDERGEVVARIAGSTECLDPVMPRHLAARTEDGFFETVLPCRKCVNCLRRADFQLRKRLVEHFKDSEATLWLVTVEATLERQSVLRARLSRTASCSASFGFFRVGAAGFALIVSGARPNLRAIRSSLSCTAKATRIRKPRVARAWRAAPAGMQISRSVYGEWTKRFYMRGLKPLRGEKFIIERRGGIRKRHPEAKAGFRAWRDGLTLYHSDLATVAEWMSVLAPARAAAASAYLVNRRRAQRAVPASAMAGFRDVAGAHGATGDPFTAGLRLMKHAPATTSILRPRRALARRGRDAGSQLELPGFAAEFLARMRKLERDRGG